MVCQGHIFDIDPTHASNLRSPFDQTCGIVTVGPISLRRWELNIDSLSNNNKKGNTTHNYFQDEDSTLTSFKLINWLVLQEFDPNWTKILIGNHKILQNVWWKHTETFSENVPSYDRC